MGGAISSRPAQSSELVVGGSNMISGGNSGRNGEATSYQRETPGGPRIGWGSSRKIEDRLPPYGGSLEFRVRDQPESIRLDADEDATFAFGGRSSVRKGRPRVSAAQSVPAQPLPGDRGDLEGGSSCSSPREEDVVWSSPLPVEHQPDVVWSSPLPVEHQPPGGTPASQFSSRRREEIHQKNGKLPFLVRAGPKNTIKGEMNPKAALKYQVNNSMEEDSMDQSMDGDEDHFHTPAASISPSPMWTKQAAEEPQHRDGADVDVGTTTSWIDRDDEDDHMNYNLLDQDDDPPIRLTTLEKAAQLEKAIQKTVQLEKAVQLDNDNSDVCCICLDEPPDPNHVLPCGHCNMCQACVEELLTKVYARCP